MTCTSDSWRRYCHSLLVTPLGALAERIGIGNALTLLVMLGIAGCALVLLLPETKRVIA
jgi:hypothetical protein